MSQFLTLQGAVAHVDMPLESGPTTFLPYSQRCEENYMLWRREDFKEYYKENKTQQPLEKGDAVFFNPGLIHAAGDNVSFNVDRMANLVQVRPTSAAKATLRATGPERPTQTKLFASKSIE